MRAGKPDAMELALERAAVGSQPCSDKRSASGVGDGWALAGIDAGLREQAANAAGLDVIAALERGERGGLLGLDAVERRCKARDHAVDVANRGLAAGSRGQCRLVVDRCWLGHRAIATA